MIVAKLNEQPEARSVFSQHGSKPLLRSKNHHLCQGSQR